MYFAIKADFHVCIAYICCFCFFSSYLYIVYDNENWKQKEYHAIMPYNWLCLMLLLSVYSNGKNLSSYNIKIFQYIHAVLCLVLIC